MYNQRKQVVAPVKRPASRNLQPIKTGRQQQKREQLNDRKQYQQAQSTVKPLSDKIISLIRQHLMIHGYARSVETLKKEKPLINRTPISHQSANSKYGAVKTDDLKVAIRYFQKGQRDQFFKQAFKFFDCNLDEIKKLEFELQVYFCIYSVHVMGKRQTTIDRQAVEGFKKFLDAHGSQMAQNVELIPFFALPHNNKPQQSAIFSTIFTKEWVYKLKTKTNEMLKKAIGQNSGSDNKQKENHKKSTLDQIYEKHTNESEAEKKKEHKQLEQYKHEVDQYRNQLAECKSHNESLLQYINRLSYSIEELGESSKSNLIESNKKWFIFIKELLYTVRRGSKGIKIEGLQKYEGFFGKNVDEILNNADISIFDKASMVMDDISMTRINRTNNDMKNKQGASSQIDVVKIQTMFANAGNPGKEIEVCLLLRALKNRFSKAKNPYTKRQVVVEYSRHDICGITPQKYYIQKQLLVEGSPKIREFYLRLMNEICSDIYGIQYMTKSDKLIGNLMDILKKEKSSNKDYSRFLLGILQKFSYPKKSRSLMISLGIIPLIFEMFSTQQQEMTDFTIQYLMAMIMNISLTRQSEKHFSQYKAEMLEIFIRLLEIDNEKIKNYVNGSLYLVLNFKQIMQEARKQNLQSKMIEIMDQYDSENKQQDNFYGQYQYIIGKVRGQIEIAESDEADSESQGEEAIQLDEFEEDDEEDDDDADSTASSEYIQGEDGYLTDDQLLTKEFMLLGPEALKEQMLTKSVLDETSRKLDNLTLSINHSKRMDNIFNNSHKDKGSQQLQPELDRLLRQDQEIAVSPTLGKKSSLR